MKVCLLTSAHFPPREGIGNYVWNLARFLVLAGHSAVVVTRGRGAETTQETLPGITIWRCAYLPVYPFHVHLHGLFVNRLLAQLGPDIDIIHAHSPLVPTPVTPHPLLVTVHTPMLADARAIRLINAQAALVKLQVPISYRLELQLLQRAGAVAAVATSVAQELREYGLKSAEVAVLGNGADTTGFSPAARPVAPTVTAAGRLALRKGFGDLIDCAGLVVAKVPEARFLIAGDGPQASALQRKITGMGLTSHVRLLGHVAGPERMRDLYRQAAVFVHPAHYEGLPTVMLEAMACGCPVVATAVSGALDVIAPGENGLLVPPRDPARMAEAIADLLHDPATCERLGRAARATVEARYSWQVVGAQYLQLYRDLLGASS